MSTTRRWTEAELMKLNAEPGRIEVVDGEIVRMAPAGWRHGVVEARLLSRLVAHVEAEDLGWCVSGDTGTWMPSGNLRAPDVAFVRKDRFPEGPPRGFSEVVPDLVAEVLSPDDRAADVVRKLAEYQAAGIELIWVLDPDARTATVIRAGSTPEHLAEDGVLDGAAVLPGFRCSLSKIWA